MIYMITDFKEKQILSLPPELYRLAAEQGHADAQYALGDDGKW